MEEETHTSRPRLVLHDFLSHEECEELEFIHKSNCTVGYRPNVFSTTLSHLIATGCAHFIVPFVPIRERVKEKVEEFFGCEFELFVEFTGLISWTTGASIGWHSDDNRPYLKQRDFTAVCYLNSYGKDFKGGLFHFRDGEPATVAPMAGDVMLYTADSCNIHSVDEITEGERLTLTLWFSRDSGHDEDAKLISQLSELSLCSSENALDLNFPQPASSNMYWFSVDPMCQELGFDICCARMHVLGFDIYSSRESSSDFTELLLEPLQVVHGSELFEQKFVNILHSLQALQFYFWKARDLAKVELHTEANKVVQLSQSQQEKTDALKSVLLKDHTAVEKIVDCRTCSCNKNLKHGFDWARFSAAVSELKDHTRKLNKVLFTSLPHWRTQNIIYSVPALDGI